MTLNLSFSNVLDNLEGPLTLGLKDERGTLPSYHIKKTLPIWLPTVDDDLVLMVERVFTSFLYIKT